MHAGSSGGLSLELFVGIPKLLEMIAYHYGIVVFIHSSKSSPLSIQPILVSTNQETNIVVYKMTSDKQPQPYSECQNVNSFKSDLKDLILNNGFS